MSCNFKCVDIFFQNLCYQTWDVAYLKLRELNGLYSGVYGTFYIDNIESAYIPVELQMLTSP